MNKIIVGFTALFFAISASAQMANPVQWTFTSKKIADKTYEIHMTASITGGKYHLYSQTNNADAPSTSITFIKNPLLTMQGKVKEVGKLISKMEPVFGFKVNYYMNTVDFVQLVKSKVTAPASVKGSVEYIVCDDKQCLPPKTIDFDVKVGGN